MFDGGLTRKIVQAISIGENDVPFAKLTTIRSQQLKCQIKLFRYLQRVVNTFFLHIIDTLQNYKDHSFISADWIYLICGPTWFLQPINQEIPY